MEPRSVRLFAAGTWTSSCPSLGSRSTSCASGWRPTCISGTDCYPVDVVSRTTVVHKLTQAGAALPVALAAVGLGGEDWPVAKDRGSWYQNLERPAKKVRCRRCRKRFTPPPGWTRPICPPCYRAE